MNFLRQILLVSTFSFFLLCLPHSSFAEQVSVKSLVSDGFGRIVFIWRQPVSHEMAYGNRILKIRFGRPFQGSVQQLTGRMSKYIERVRKGTDGRSITLYLTNAFEVVGFDSGNAVIFEISDIPQSMGRRKQEKSKARSKQPQFRTSSANMKDLKKVGVRTGRHSGYSRIVIDWPKKVNYKLNQENGVVLLRIAAPANLQLDMLRQRPPPFVGAVRARSSAAETIFEMAVAKTSQVRHFTSGSKLVLDISQPNGSREIAQLPDRAPPTVSNPTSIPTHASGAGYIGKKTTKSNSNSPMQLKPKKKQDSFTSPPTASEPPKPEEKASTDAVKKPSATAGVEKVKPGNSRDPSPRVMLPIGKAVQLDSILETPAPPAEGEAGEEAETTPAPIGKPGVTLKFDWKEAVAAAAFKRFGYFWVIFDRPALINPESLKAVAGPFVETIDHAPTPEATILRLRIPKSINPEFSRKGSSWIINLSKRPPSISKPIEVEVQTDSPIGERILFPVTGSGKPIGITDPTSGDNLVVIPVIPIGRGVEQSRTYPQLKVLPSLQGVVIKPLADDLRIRPLRQGVELTSGSKLAVSPVSPEAAANLKLAKKKPLTNILELEEWEVESLDEFNTRRQELQAEIASATAKQRISKRYNLARFYFANRFAAETLGVLAELKREKSDIENDPEFRLIRGGASYLMHRLSDAAADLTHDSLDGLDEGNFWRAAVVANTGDLLAAAPALTRAGVFTKNYPKPLQLQMGTLVADAAVELGETSTAKSFIKAMKKLKPDDAQLAEVEFVEGRLLNLKEDVDGAISKWEAVEKKPNSRMRARAIIARIQVLLKLKRIEPKKAIEELENLRFSWRGDVLEYRILRLLGNLYLDKGLYRKGFQALRQAKTYYQNKDENEKIVKQMQSVFSALYLRDGADDMSAVKAIAVYEEFKELTPPGEKGDEMIRKLADRLVDVDLLDQAAAILENQIQFRVRGLLKSEVGARLAIIYLLSRRYDRALIALDKSMVPDEPPELITQRRHLRARALMGLEQSALALKTLNKDKTTDADLLRAEIFSNNGEWNKAARELHKIMRASGAKKNEEVNQDQAQKILNYTIALVLSGNERGIAKIRKDFGAEIEKTNLKDAFQLVSLPIEPGLIKPSSVKSRVKIAENFKNFLLEYKKGLKKKGLVGLSSDEVAESVDEKTEGNTAGG